MSNAILSMTKALDFAARSSYGFSTSRRHDDKNPVNHVAAPLDIAQAVGPKPDGEQKLLDHTSISSSSTSTVSGSCGTLRPLRT